MVDAVYAIIMRVVTLILRLTPYGVLAIMTKTIATSDLDSMCQARQICHRFICGADRHVHHSPAAHYIQRFKSCHILEKGVSGPCIRVYI
jgi:hypothetical protein